MGLLWAPAAATMKSKPAAHKSGNTHRVSAGPDAAAGQGKAAQASAVGVSAAVVPQPRREARPAALSAVRGPAGTAGPERGCCPGPGSSSAGSPALVGSRSTLV